MSEQKQVLREIARVISGDGPFRIDEWFTEDFRLVEPTKPNWPRGHEGASKLLALFRTLTVRWQLSATYPGDPLSLVSIAIYRFKDGRIAEDWGSPIRGEWLD